jgi:hypothetical protein
MTRFHLQNRGDHDTMEQPINIIHNINIRYHWIHYQVMGPTVQTDP